MLQIALGSAVLTAVSTPFFFYILHVAAKKREEALQKATVEARRRQR